jgi:hypothetical protein
VRISNVPRRASQIDTRGADIFRANATKHAMTQLGMRRLIEEDHRPKGSCDVAIASKGAATIGRMLAGNVEAIRMASPDGAGARGPAYCGSLARMIDAESL